MTARDSAGRPAGQPNRVRRPAGASGALVVALAALLLVSGCTDAPAQPTVRQQNVQLCEANARYASEPARLKALQMVVVGTIRQAEDTEGRRIYELEIEEEIIGAPELGARVVEFSVPDDCNGSPATVAEFDVGDRVKAYLRSEDPDMIPGPLTILSPHEGLESMAP